MKISLNEILTPLGACILVFVLLLTLRGIFLRLLSRWARQTATKIDDLLIKALKIPSIYWSMAMALYIGVAVSNLPARYVFYLTRTIHIVVIFSVTLSLANLLTVLFRHYVRQTQLPIPATGIAQGIIKGAVLITGALIILNFLGFSITPLVTALGVGGLAVALGLQDTLSNLFAGIHILIEKSVRVGDFVRLETGLEGYVEDITWRTTRIRTLPNNIIIIPNSKLSQSVVINYHLPEKRMSLLLPVSVSYSSDPEKVEKILLEEARQASTEIKGLLAEPEPMVRFIPGFGESSLDFTLICQVREFVDQYLVQHELRKRIFRRFKEEGIEIPFPQRTVYLRQ